MGVEVWLLHFRIESIPSELFINMTDLIHLDLSDNNLGKHD